MKIHIHTYVHSYVSILNNAFKMTNSDEDDYNARTIELKLSTKTRAIKQFLLLWRISVVKQGNRQTFEYAESRYKICKKNVLTFELIELSSNLKE